MNGANGQFEADLAYPLPRHGDPPVIGAVVDQEQLEKRNQNKKNITITDFPPDTRSYLFTYCSCRLSDMHKKKDKILAASAIVNHSQGNRIFLLFMHVEMRSYYLNFYGVIGHYQTKKNHGRD